MNMKINDLKDNLSIDILLMMASFYDKHHQGGTSEAANAIIHASKRVTDGIAERLAFSLSHHKGKLNSKVWKAYVILATRDAFIELPDCGAVVRLGKNVSFAEAVEVCTAKTVAPAGSAWQKAVLKTEAQCLSKYLKSNGLPGKEIKRLLPELRSLNHPSSN